MRAGRLAEAAAHYGVVERRINPDLATLVNAGVLAAQAGDLERARTRLERAVALDPTSAEAQLDLADVEMLRRAPEAAVPHFRAYLARVESAGSVDERTRGVAAAVRQRLDVAETALAARASVGR